MEARSTDMFFLIVINRWFHLTVYKTVCINGLQCCLYVGLYHSLQAPMWRLMWPFIHFVVHMTTAPNILKRHFISIFCQLSVWKLLFSSAPPPLPPPSPLHPRISKCKHSTPPSPSPFSLESFLLWMHLFFSGCRRMWQGNRFLSLFPFGRTMYLCLSISLSISSLSFSLSFSLSLSLSPLFLSLSNQAKLYIF